MRRADKLASKDISICVPAGALGTGVREDEVERALSLGISAIALDAGSTDSGAFYLANGVPKYSREAVKRDLVILMKAQARSGVPLLVGSCGTSGCDAGVDWTYEIAMEVAREHNLSPKIARLYSEQTRATIKAKRAAGQVTPLPPLGALDDATIEGCDHIVALMGPEPYMDALEAGADIILGGRTTDTAVIGAYPLLKGIAPGLVWHGAKITECGGVCTVSPTCPGVLLTLREDSFDVEPLSLTNRCTPYSVAAHMLYENADPYVLMEPGGVLDVRHASYEAVDERIVRVRGGTWTPAPYTMKLEGASRGPCQTIMLIGIQAPNVLASLDLFMRNMQAALENRVRTTIGDEAGDFHISLRAYGWNAVSGVTPPDGTPPPREVGLMLVATARTQNLATRIAKTCNPYFFHFPLELGQEMPSYAFPFSPAEIERGQVCEFRLNHVVATEAPDELVRTVWAPAETYAAREAHP